MVSALSKSVLNLGVGGFSKDLISLKESNNKEKKLKINLPLMISKHIPANNKGLHLGNVVFR